MRCLPNVSWGYESEDVLTEFSFLGEMFLSLCMVQMWAKRVDGFMDWWLFKRRLNKRDKRVLRPRKNTGLNQKTNRSGVCCVVVCWCTFKVQTSSSFPQPFSEWSRQFIMTQRYLMPLQKYFSFLQEGIYCAFNHRKRLNWQIHIRGGLELHFSHFYCCSSICPCITLRNGMVHTIKRVLWIENDHITCFQIASLNGIRVWPACVLYWSEEIKWQNKPIFRLQCIYAGGPHWWEKQLTIKYCFDSIHAALGLWSGWNLLSCSTGHFNGMGIREKWHFAICFVR